MFCTQLCRVRGRQHSRECGRMWKGGAAAGAIKDRTSRIEHLGIDKTRAMRNGKEKKRMRWGNRKTHNPLTRVYELNGPDVKIRGTALSHCGEIRAARPRRVASGDPVSAENYLQHAEHYFRLIPRRRSRSVRGAAALSRRRRHGHARRPWRGGRGSPPRRAA